MKRCFSLLMMIICVFCATAALAAAPRPTFVPVKWFHRQHRDPRVQRHHAHKAGKHQARKSHRHAV